MQLIDHLKRALVACLAIVACASPAVGADLAAENADVLYRHAVEDARGGAVAGPR